MNQKLKYGITLVILTSIVTNQKIDAAYLWQRAKDIYNYRPYSAITGLGLGGYAFTTQDTKYKILAGLLSAMFLKRACNVDTSTLEDLISENTGLFSQYFKDKINETPTKTLYNLTTRLHNATTDTQLKAQIAELFQVVQEEMQNKNEKQQRSILDKFFSDPSTIQEKIRSAKKQQQFQAKKNA